MILKLGTSINESSSMMLPVRNLHCKNIMHWERLMFLQPQSQSSKPLSKETMGTQQLDSGLDSLRRYAQFAFLR